MPNNARLTQTVRRAAVVAAAGAAAAAIAGLGSGAAHAAVGDNLPSSCLQVSQDGGNNWGTTAVITWNNARPIPGGEVKQASFKVRNNCATAAKFQVYTGNWSLPDGGSATVRANAGSVQGTKTALAGIPKGHLLAETGRLTKDAPVNVELFVGIPASETAQGFTIKPAWNLALEEVAGDSPVDPVDPVDPGDCNNSSASGSASGSLGDILGPILCSDTGSLGSGSAASKLIQLDSPNVVAASR
jgi:hypothetical protein